MTEAGRRRQRLRRRVHENVKTTNAVNEIVSTLNPHDKKLLYGTEPDDREWIDKENEYDISANLAKRIIKQHGDIPVSMFEIWDNGTEAAYVAVATRSGDEYRGKGYAQKAVNDGLNWYNRYGKQKIKNLYWVADKTNEGSIRLAEKSGFTKLSEKDAPGKEKDFVYYRYKK